MSVLVHPQSVPREPREPRQRLRLLERPARRGRVGSTSVPSSAASRPVAWLDRWMERLAEWAADRTPAHRMGSWTRGR